MEVLELLLFNLNSIGLCLDIVGALMLFKFGLPEDVRRDGTYFIAIETQDAAEVSKAKRYDFLAKVSLGFILFGFILQFVHSILFG